MVIGRCSWCGRTRPDTEAEIKKALEHDVIERCHKCGEIDDYWNYPDKEAEGQ